MKEKNHRPKPWFSIPFNNNKNNHVIIIGGGISGATTAYSLASRGYNVTIYEKNLALAMGASGNYQGILYGNFYGNFTPIIELSLAGFKYSHNLIKNTLTKSEYQICGLIQLANNIEQIKQQQQLLNATHLPNNFCYSIDIDKIQKYSTLKINCQTGLHFPDALWISPPALVKKLCKHKNIKIICNNFIDNIKLNHNNIWEIYSNHILINQAPNIVLCNAHELQQFSYTKSILLRKIRGQLSLIKSHIPLETILCYGGYVTPNFNEFFTIGATFKFNDTSLAIKEIEHMENINNIVKIFPQFKNIIKDVEIIGQAGIRASTSDYLPLVGPLAKQNEFFTLYKNLEKDSNYWIEDDCPYLPGLYINAAHGSKGILTAPISGEIIAQYINNEPHTITNKLLQAIHPNRFWVKEIIKKSKK